jgi:Zn-dependent M16 (insulinase) family peptidase
MVLNNYNLDSIFEENGYNAESYVNETNGLRILYFNKPSSNYMSMNVMTPPLDNTGLTHVIEHCIASGIMPSYLNDINFCAQTFKDKTCYEICCDEDEYFFDVAKSFIKKILDSKILTDKYIFLREGWRIEKSKDSMRFSGIVLNEMMEVYYNSKKLLLSKVAESLYGETFYEYFSGGFPDEIIKLSYQDVINYYKKYYTLSNIYIVISSSRKHFIKIINELDKYDSKRNLNNCFDNLNYQNRNIDFDYPILNQKNANNNIFSMNFIVKKPDNSIKYSVYNLIAEILLNKKIGLISKIGNHKFKRSEIQYYFNNTIKDSFFSFIAFGMKNNDGKIFKQRFYESLNCLLKDNDLLSNKIDEIYNESKKGMYTYYKENMFYLNRLIMESWPYENNPFTYFNNNFKSIKEIDLDLVKQVLDEQFITNNKKTIMDPRIHTKKIKILRNKINKLIYLNDNIV